MQKYGEVNKDNFIGILESISGNEKEINDLYINIRVLNYNCLCWKSLQRFSTISYSEYNLIPAEEKNKIVRINVKECGDYKNFLNFTFKTFTLKKQISIKTKIILNNYDKDIKKILLFIANLSQKCNLQTINKIITKCDNLSISIEKFDYWKILILSLLPNSCLKYNLACFNYTTQEYINCDNCNRCKYDHNCPLCTLYYNSNKICNNRRFPGEFNCVNSIRVSEFFFSANKDLAQLTIDRRDIICSNGITSVLKICKVLNKINQNKKLTNN